MINLIKRREEEEKKCFINKSDAKTEENAKTAIHETKNAICKIVRFANIIASRGKKCKKPPENIFLSIRAWLV